MSSTTLDGCLYPAIAYCLPVDTYHTWYYQPEGNKPSSVTLLFTDSINVDETPIPSWHECIYKLPPTSLYKYLEVAPWHRTCPSSTPLCSTRSGILSVHQAGLNVQPETCWQESKKIQTQCQRDDWMLKIIKINLRTTTLDSSHDRETCCKLRMGEVWGHKLWEVAAQRCYLLITDAEVAKVVTWDCAESQSRISECRLWCWQCESICCEVGQVRWLKWNC